MAYPNKITTFVTEMQKIKKIITEDGSHSFYVPVIDEHYHSHKGAIQESQHIFIGEGLLKHPKQELNILEVGFGTGLNAFLTYIIAPKHQKRIRYVGLEKYPLKFSDVENLNYAKLIDDTQKEIFEKMHSVEWNKFVEISDFFELKKREVDFTQVELEEQFDIIYFDAFSPDKQSEMWSEKAFEKIYRHTKTNGVLVTYSVKGSVKRALKNVGFKTEKRPGPPGKREILVAKK